MARSTRTSSVVKAGILDNNFVLQLLLGLFFLMLGIYGIMPSIQESVFSLWDSNQNLEIAFGIFELACSLVLLASLIMYTRRRLIYLASIGILIFWAARIVLSKFIIGITVSGGRFYFAGGFYHWALILSVELIILTCIFKITRQYR